MIILMDVIDYNKCLNKKNFSLSETELTAEIKEALLNSLNSESFNYYTPNPQKLFSHEIDFKILSDVFFKFKNTLIFNKILDEKLLKYAKKRPNHFDLENFKNRLTNDFHSTLNLCIEHYVYYHKNSFSKNVLHQKKYYQTLKKEETLFDLYSMAINEIVIGNNCISYSIENVNKNTYNYIHLSLTNNIKNSTRHKRYNHIQAKKELFRIKKIENGTPNKTYYPFYFQTKKDLLKLTQEKSYAFLLETREINLLINEILIICKNEINKSKINKNELNEDLKLFFSNQLDISINTLLFIKNKKVLNYLFYKLDKKGKCNTNILFSKIKILNKTKYLPIKYFNLDVKNFNKNNALPKQYKLIDNVIKLISQN